jgi:hypothetical protein
MADNKVYSSNLEPMPADKAALRSFRLAFLALAVGGLTLWLANFFGAMACNIGLVVWLLCLIPAVVMAVTALRGAVFSDTPRLVRRQALVSLVVIGVNLVLGLAFIWAVVQAI